MCPPPSRRGEDAAQEPSLRANGSRECAPDDRVREAIHGRSTKEWIASVASLLAMTANTMGSLSSDPQDGRHAALARRWQLWQFAKSNRYGMGRQPYPLNSNEDL